MFIDCGTCSVRGTGCDDCVVTVLLGAPELGDGTCEAPPDSRVGVEVGADERRAFAVLAQVGLVPELRHSDTVRRVS
jgi:hypothetical protein